MSIDSSSFIILVSEVTPFLFFVQFLVCDSYLGIEIGHFLKHLPLGENSPLFQQCTQLKDFSKSSYPSVRKWKTDDCYSLCNNFFLGNFCNMDLYSQAKYHKSWKNVIKTLHTCCDLCKNVESFCGSFLLSDFK